MPPFFGMGNTNPIEFSKSKIFPLIYRYVYNYDVSDQKISGEISDFENSIGLVFPMPKNDGILKISQFG